MFAGVPFDIDFDTATLIAGLRPEVEAIEFRDRVAIGRGAKDTLRNADRGVISTGWYDTSAQQEGYGWRPAAPGRVVITNRARNPRDGFPYPILNERRYRVVQRILGGLRRSTWIDNIRRYRGG